MQKLLIVDDEPNIVEGLVAQIEDLNIDSLFVLKAYSGKQALSILKSNKVDVVLSDIKMGEINGLDLLEETNRLWPKIRFIFLTGYGDFEYIHTASKSPIYAGYLLKTEGDEVIINKVIMELDAKKKSVENGKVLISMQKQISKVQPLLHRIYLENIIKGPVSISDLETDGVLNLDIDAGKPVLLIVGKIMKKHDHMFQFRDMILADKLLQSETISIFNSECVLCEGHLIWIIQPGQNKIEKGKEICDEPAFSGYINAVFQSVQQQLNDYYDLPITFIISSHMVEVADIHIQYELLKTILSMLKLDNQNLMIVDQDISNDILISGEKIHTSEQVKLSIGIKKLEEILESGRASEFKEAFDGIFMSSSGEYMKLHTEEILLLIMLLLSAVERHALTDLLSENSFLANGIISNKITDYDIFFSQYIDICCKICDMRIEHERMSKENSINIINQYIDENIGDYNLSLSQIARVSGFNPSYLSRFYKQNTGEKLSEYISFKKLELAKSLLNQGLLIRDVATKIGYESPSSFIYFFKKSLGITPKQYQSQVSLMQMNS